VGTPQAVQCIVWTDSINNINFKLHLNVYDKCYPLLHLMFFLLKFYFSIAVIKALFYSMFFVNLYKKYIVRMSFKTQLSQYSSLNYLYCKMMHIYRVYYIAMFSNVKLNHTCNVLKIYILSYTQTHIHSYVPLWKYLFEFDLLDLLNQGLKLFKDYLLFLWANNIVMLGWLYSLLCVVLCISGEKVVCPVQVVDETIISVLTSTSVEIKMHFPSFYSTFTKQNGF